MAAHRPVGHGEALKALNAIDFVTRVEYVGGTRDGQSEDRGDLPETINFDDGVYGRSVRCAEDGAIRYVWNDSATDRRQRHG